MSVKIIRSRVGSEKNDIMLRSIEEVHEKHPDDQCFIFVPENFSFETEKLLVDRFGGCGLNNIDVLTPVKMAYTFLNSRDINYLKPSGKKMLLSRAVNEYCKTAEASLLVNSMQKTGFLGSIEQLFNDFKNYSVSEENLAAAGMGEEGKLHEKITAVAEIYRSYNEFFANGDYSDSADDMIRITNVIREKKDYFNEDLYIWVDNFDDILPTDFNMFSALAENGVNLTFAVNFPEAIDGNEELTYISVKKTYEKLRTLKGYEGDIICKNGLGSVKSDNIKFLLNNFSIKSGECSEKPGDISIFRGSDAYSEIEHAACVVSALIREGYRYRDIVIVSGKSNENNHIIKAVFDEYGIPYFSDEKILLSDHPAALQILSVFDIAENDWNYESVFSYLRSGFIYNEKGEHLSQSDLDMLENFVLKYGKRGKKAWCGEEWKSNKDALERVWDDENDDAAENDSTDEKITEIDRRVNEIRRSVILPLSALFEKVHGKRTAKEFSTALFEFLGDINFAAGLEKDIEQFADSGKTEEAEQFSRIWDLILETLDQSVVTSADEPISFDEYASLIRAGLSGCEIKTIPTCLDGVCVGAVERSTAAPVKVIFLINAVNHTFPDISDSEGFFSEKEKEILADKYNTELSPGNKEFADTAYLQVYKAIAPATEKLYLSTHVQAEDGKDITASRLISDVCEIFPALGISDGMMLGNDDISYITSPSATIHKLVVNIASGKPLAPEWREVKKWYHDNKIYENKLQIVKDADSFLKDYLSIDNDSANKLYVAPSEGGGDDMVYSASRINTFELCPFMYFMHYGLKARKHEMNDIEANNFGSYAHEMIREYCSKVESDAVTPAEKLARWKNLTDAENEKIIADINEKNIEKIRSFPSYDTEKRISIMNRAAKTISKSTEVIHKSLKCGLYTTKGSEVEFDKVKIADGVYLTGKIDRLDSYSDGNDEYIRIIDYKTGSKDLKFRDIYYGVDMQLVIYAIAAQKLCGDAKISGMYYEKVMDPNISLKYSEKKDITKEINKVLSLDGATFFPKDAELSADNPQLNAICDSNSDISADEFVHLVFTKNKGLRQDSYYNEDHCRGLIRCVKENIVQADSRIRKGDVDIRPNQFSTPCDFCDYKSACIFEHEKYEQENASVKTKAKDEKECKAEIEEKGKEAER